MAVAMHLAVALLLASSAAGSRPPPQKLKPLKVAFGSCNRPEYTTRIWDRVAEYQPDAWVWMGDNAYLDRGNLIMDRGFRFRGIPVAKKLYKMLHEREDYTRAMSTVKDFFGTWDDHDYGINNGGASFPQKQATKELTVEFLKFPEGHPVRDENFEGIYHSYIVAEGTPTEVKFILPDTRWFRTDNVLLGDKQMAWLEKEIADCEGRPLCVLVSSVQVTARWGDNFSLLELMETWAHYPSELTRLLTAIEGVRTTPTIVLSGDVHMGDMRVINDAARQGAREAVCEFGGVPLTRPLVEITSSGITHTIGTFLAFPSWIWGSFLSNVDVAQYAASEDMQRKILIFKNFGTLDFDGHTVTLALHGEEPHEVFPITYSRDELLGMTAGAQGDATKPAQCISEETSPGPYSTPHLIGAIIFYVTVNLVCLALPPLAFGWYILKRLRRNGPALKQE
eukprot:TRINITY_DN35494_c0_g1_i1.p1 TRINITY_DN35494_c0_g1~~TRINITY_DN35494_c0_g1_i1.p1  ORF type:complete len:451 (+),score=189.65 TRINITY_DN35494_c0_g1_i1:75-1427(+)